MTTEPPKVTSLMQWQTRVQLRSNDGERYEIYRQTLINRSGFFANLFQVPRPGIKGVDVGANKTILVNDAKGSDDRRLAAAADEDIDIDIPMKDLALFADFMQITDQFERFVRSANLELDVHQAGILLPLIDKFDCEFMRAVLMIKIASLAKTQPWEILHLSCKHDDLDMARTAISNLTTSSICTYSAESKIDTTIWTQLSTLSGAWQLEFLRLYVPGIQTPTYGRPTGSLNDDFAAWAKDFDPKKYQEADGVDGKRKRI